MRMCMDHWTQLREAIASRGLSALVAEGGEAAVRNLTSEMAEGRTIDNFDPLMAAHNAILGNAMGLVGLAAMADNDDGSERCPLCYINQQLRASWEKSREEGAKVDEPYPCGDPRCQETHIFPAGPPNYDGWIDRAADDSVDEWKRIGGAA